MEKKSYRYNREPESYRLLKRKNIYFRAHFHPQIEVAFCVKGICNILIDGTTYHLNQGDVAVIFPNQRHYYQPPGEDKDNGLYLLLFYPTDTPDYYREWNFFKPEVPVIRKEQLPVNFPVIWDLFYETYEENDDYMVFKAYIALLMAQMLPRMKLNSVDEDYNPEDIQSVLNYINQHFREDITLTKVAKELGFHPNRLSTFFNEKIGCSFTSHIKALRIENARHLLKATRYSVNEIRILSGFQSNRTFFRCFKEEFGMTPVEYREAAEKKTKKTEGA